MRNHPWRRAISPRGMGVFCPAFGSGVDLSGMMNPHELAKRRAADARIMMIVGIALPLLALGAMALFVFMFSDGDALPPRAPVSVLRVVRAVRSGEAPELVLRIVQRFGSVFRLAMPTPSRFYVCADLDLAREILLDPLSQKPAFVRARGERERVHKRPRPAAPRWPRGGGCAWSARRVPPTGTPPCRAPARARSRMRSGPRSRAARTPSCQEATRWASSTARRGRARASARRAPSRPSARSACARHASAASHAGSRASCAQPRSPAERSRWGHRCGG